MESVLAVQLQVWCENRATAIYHDGFLVNLSLLTGVLQRKAPAIDVVTPLGVWSWEVIFLSNHVLFWLSCQVT